MRKISLLITAFLLTLLTYSSYGATSPTPTASRPAATKLPSAYSGFTLSPAQLRAATPPIAQTGPAANPSVAISLKPLLNRPIAVAVTTSTTTSEKAGFFHRLGSKLSQAFHTLKHAWQSVRNNPLLVLGIVLGVAGLLLMLLLGGAGFVIGVLLFVAGIVIILLQVL